MHVYTSRYEIIEISQTAETRDTFENNAQADHIAGQENQEIIARGCGMLNYYLAEESRIIIGFARI